MVEARQEYWDYSAILNEDRNARRQREPLKHLYCHSLESYTDTLLYLLHLASEIDAPSLAHKLLPLPDNERFSGYIPPNNTIFNGEAKPKNVLKDPQQHMYVKECLSAIYTAPWLPTWRRYFF